MANETKTRDAEVRPIEVSVEAQGGVGALTLPKGAQVQTVADRLPGRHRARRPLRERLGGDLGLLVSFILLVVVPMTFAGIYFGFIASNIYVSESKFAVRGSVEKLPGGSAGASAAAAGPLANLGSLMAVNNNQDAFVVADYIRSMPLVQKLDRDRNLHSLFMRNDTDPISRLADGYSIEKLQRYWDKMVTTTVDNISGILTLKVQAFTAEDALTLSNVLLAESETLVNEISDRRLRDSVKFAKEEVAHSEERLQAARLAVEQFRNQSGLVDPVKQTEATLKLLMGLKTERLGMMNELTIARRTLNEKAPSVQVLSSRVKAMSDQIEGLERLVTSQQEGAKTASRALFQFEGFELERLFAEKLYLVSQAALERARVNAERQQLYLVTFVKPALAESALYPRRITNIILVGVCAAAIWSILCLIGAAVKDHLA